MAAQCAAADADDAALEKIGVRRVDLTAMDWAPWAAAAETVSPLLAAQDDEGQPHANDLLELNFPAGEVLTRCRDAVAPFCDPSQLELYDAFSLHYDSRQTDTTFNQHRDPSFVTINVCLRSEQVEGSRVEFFGTWDGDGAGPRLRAEQRAGFALVHRGRHLHQTTPLVKGIRSQAVLYWTRRGVVGDDDATYLGFAE